MINISFFIKKIILFGVVGISLSSHAVYGMLEEEDEKHSVYLLGDHKIEKEPIHSPYINCVVYKEKEFFSKEFIVQTEKFIDSEVSFRTAHNFRKNVNVAQVCFYGLYSDNKVKIFEEHSDKFQSVFYLSGNTPYTFKKKDHEGDKYINIQKININKKIKTNDTNTIVIQRAQPMAKSVEITLDFLLKAEEYIDHHETSTRTKELIKGANHKYEQIKEFRKNQNKVIEILEEMSKKTEKDENSNKNRPMILGLSCNPLKAEELKASIECDDFYFKVLKEKPTKENIEAIQKSLLPKGISEFCDIFNTKFINFGCSEQLIFQDLGNEMRRNFLSQNVSEAFEKENLKSIQFHIHTTKVPCKASNSRPMNKTREKLSFKKYFSHWFQ